MVILTAALAIFAVIPFGSVLPPLGISGRARSDSADWSRPASMSA